MAQLFIQGLQQVHAWQTAQLIKTHMGHHIHIAVLIQCLDRQVQIQLADICKILYSHKPVIHIGVLVMLVLQTDNIPVKYTS